MPRMILRKMIFLMMITMTAMMIALMMISKIWKECQNV